MRTLVKTILIAHRDDDVRRRFAGALADAPHRVVTAESAQAVITQVTSHEADVHLAILDLRLADDPAALVLSTRQAATSPVVLLFASTVSTAHQVLGFAGLGVVGYINDHVGTSHILPALAPYLFPDNFNRRASQRVALGVPISYRAGQTIAGAVTLDVGKGGLAIRTMSPLPPGTKAHVKFRLPGTPADLEAVGRVIWSDRQVGMGLEFETVSPADQATIDAFVGDVSLFHRSGR